MAMIDFNDAKSDTANGIAGTMAAKALAYAEAGIPVFPCNPLDKAPLIAKAPGEKGGFHAATTNALQIKAWWAKWPNAMIGAPTGKASGFVALDIDQNPAREKYGVASLEAFGHPLEELFDNPHTQTAGGGYHVFFAYEPSRPITNARGALPVHVDIRGDGGYVILAGSRTADGRAYTALADLSDTPLTPAPEWLHEAVRAGGAGASGSNTSPLDFNTARKLGDNAAQRAALIPPGQWHDRTRDLVARMVREGSTDETILALAPHFTAEGYSHDQTARDFAAHIRTARAKWGYQPGPAPQPETAEAQAFDAVPFDGEVPPPRPWSFGNLLLHRAVTAMAAPPGTGKSTFTIQLGIAFATGRPFGPYDPRRTGPAWIWNNEDDRDELNRRSLAACQVMNVRPAELAGKLYMNTGAERALIVAREDRKSGALIATPDVARVIEVIKARGIKLLVVDPFAETYAATEIDNDMMKEVTGLYRQIAREGDCSVMLVHHTPKSATADTMAGSLDAFRGGGSIGGVVRIAVTLFEMTEGDAEQFGLTPEECRLYVRLDDAKANMSLKSGLPTWWRKQTVLLGNGTGDEPEDAVGVLIPWQFERASARALKSQDNSLARLCDEIVRVALNNGCTSPERAMPLKQITEALDPVKTGMKATAARDLIIGRIAPRAETELGTVVVTAFQRGAYTHRNVHIEPNFGQAEEG